jgi:hypothetical protein
VQRAYLDCDYSPSNNFNPAANNALDKRVCIASPRNEDLLVVGVRIVEGKHAALSTASLLLKLNLGDGRVIRITYG